MLIYFKRLANAFSRQTFQYIFYIFICAYIFFTIYAHIFILFIRWRTCHYLYLMQSIEAFGYIKSFTWIRCLFSNQCYFRLSLSFIWALYFCRHLFFVPWKQTNLISCYNIYMYTYIFQKCRLWAIFLINQIMTFLLLALNLYLLRHFPFEKIINIEYY